jgi:SAM-dependent methyltransferase
MRTTCNRQGETFSVITDNSPKNRKDAFPLLYHTHHRDYVDDLTFWIDLAREQSDPILELGCGTGRVLIPLAEAGFRVFGIDLDPGMLAVLQENIPSSLETRITLTQADLASFHLDQQFSLIIVPCNTYSTLNVNIRNKALGCIHEHLKTGGLFTVSIPNPTILARLEPSDNPEIETIFTHPSTGYPVQVSCDWERGANQVIINWHYDHLLPDGQVERLTTTIKHFLTTSEEYRQEIVGAGFNIRAVYGNFDRSPYRSKSPNFIILAEKI